MFTEISVYNYIFLYKPSCGKNNYWENEGYKMGEITTCGLCDLKFQHVTCPQ